MHPDCKYKVHVPGVQTMFPPRGGQQARLGGSAQQRIREVTEFMDGVKVISCHLLEMHSNIIMALKMLFLHLSNL